MRQILVLFLFFTLLASCNREEKPITDQVNIPGTSGSGIDKNNFPDIKFEEDVFDFGTITQGEKVSHEFKFKNIGKRNLIISNAYADCGCTVAEVPKKPISPSEENRIKVSFDSDGKHGTVVKTITILTNCMPNKRAVKIKATIFVPEPK